MDFKHRLGFALVLLVTIALMSMILPNALADQTEKVSKSKLLYEENFSTSKGSLWGGDLGNNFSYYFDDGKYILNVNQLNTWRTVSLGQNYDNFVLEVEATQQSGPNDNVYGVAVRKVDWNNYYLFLISGDGYYEFAKYQNGTWSPSDWRKSSAIHTGNATNLIRVECNGTNLSFYANDVKLNDYTDTSFPSGTIGLTCGTNNAKGDVTVAFDNLRIWEIER